MHKLILTCKKINSFYFLILISCKYLKKNSLSKHDLDSLVTQKTHSKQMYFGFLPYFNYDNNTNNANFGFQFCEMISNDPCNKTGLIR